MKALLLALVSFSAFAQTYQPVPLRVYTRDGINSDTIIDNRSVVNRRLKFVTVACSGSGSWSASLLYGSTTASFSSYGSSATVTNVESTPTAWGFLFSPPNYIKIDLTGTVSCDFSGFQDLYATGGSSGSITYPIPVASGGTGATTASAARSNLGIVDSLSSTQTPSGDQDSANNVFTVSIGGTWTVASVDLMLNGVSLPSSAFSYLSGTITISSEYTPSSSDQLVAIIYYSASY